jgi:hypothetical protein
MDGRYEEGALSVARFAPGGGGAQSTHNKRLYAAAHTCPPSHLHFVTSARGVADGGSSLESHHWEDHPDYGCCFVTTTSKLPNVPPETTQIAYFFLDGADKCRLVWKCQRPDIEECATYTFYGVRGAQPPAL